MQIETDGIVLKEQNTGENDRVVTILTRSNGIIRAFARGSRRLRSANGAATQLLCYSRFVIFRGRDAYIIDEAETKQMFFGLRKEIEKLALAQYFCELAVSLVPEEEEAEQFLRLFLNGFHYLETEKRPIRQVKSIVELRALSYGGYMPNLLCCGICGDYESDEMIFKLKDGVIVCSKCFKSDGRPWAAVSRGVLSALRHIIYAPFPKLFSFELPEEGLRQLGSVTEKYVLVQLERSFKTLDFYHQIPGCGR